MSKDFDIQPGDRVRITIEGEVKECDEFLTTLKGDIYIPRHVVRKSKVEITERANPPVVTFKPGDRVRSKWWWSDYEYTLGHGGYFDHTSSQWHAGAEDPFTSASYELVELVPKPF